MISTLTKSSAGKNSRTSIFSTVAILVFAMMTFSSCATVFGGRISSCQRHKPSPKQGSRQIRVVALVADILVWWPGAIIDFADGAIYRPCRMTRQGTRMGSNDKGYIPDDEEDKEENSKEEDKG